jgi:N-acylglucosamine 2-epimerase
MQTARLLQLRDTYRRALLEDVIPFWLRHSLDRDYGGYLTCLDREGAVYNTDKQMWMQAREVWLFSTLYNRVEGVESDVREAWLDAARLGYRFLDEHGYAPDGRMYFLVTRDGRPLRRRRYLFSETFGVIAGAAYAAASGDEGALARAVATYELLVRLSRIPGALAPKVNPQTRATRALAMPMILLATTQELRQAASSPLCDRVAAGSVEEITGLFLKRDERALHEVVGPQGQRIDSPEGRLVNPGHAIESAWFLLHEAMAREDAGEDGGAIQEDAGAIQEDAGAIQEDALDILRWSLDWGWDREHGGLLYFVDIENKPPEQLEWDMKLWWPHTEALYATLLAYHLTGEAEFAAWFERLHAYAWSHFADPEHGEWFGYLHRDGSVALPVKGSLWKGAFHLPRALWLCWSLLERMVAASPPPEGGSVTT